MARTSDTIGALKAKLNPGWSDDLCFHFAGLELQNERSLSQCGIAPNDTIEVTLVRSEGMRVFVKLFSTGVTFVTHTVELNSSDSVSLLKIKIWVLTGVPPWDSRLIFAGRRLELERTLASYNIQHECTIHMVLQQSLAH